MATRCPMCSTHEFRIHGRADVEVTATFAPGQGHIIHQVITTDIDWDHESDVECVQCGWNGAWGDLEPEAP